MIVFIYLSYVLFSLHPVEADKDPTQSLVYEASEEKLSAAQTTCEVSDKSITIAPSSDQEASALPSEESVTVQSTAIKISSELIQPVAIESEISIEQSSQESVPQTKSESLPVETQQTDSEASTCLLTDAACKKEVITPVAQIESATTPTETKLETSVSATQDATELTTTLTSVDSSQNITASSVTSEPSLKETAKHVIESDIMQPLTIDPSEQHADVLLAASEISTISPVPIQVAESVLQAEPKESLSGATAADQAIATTVTAVHESTDIASASITVEPIQLNGSVCEKRDHIATVDADLSKSSNISTQKAKEPANNLVITKDASEAPSATIDKVESVSSVVPSETLSAKVEKVTESAEQIVKTETTELAEQAKEVEIMEAAAKSPSEIPETSESSSAEESTEAKALNIPSTPTVIEATPPTSPSVESTQEVEEKQAGKKSLKKSDSADVDGGVADGESADKKAKKTVKKVAKKPKTKSEEATPSTADGAAAADGSQSKVKKSVKVTKKIGSKTGQTLETDTTVPETPPPPSPAAVASDAPVPPKRKTKSTNAKGTTGKKPEAEE